MKCRIEKSDFLEGINIVSKAVSSGKSTLPILECIHIEASDTGLQLTGNNLEMAIRTPSISADIEEIGSIALNARLLAEIVKKLPDDELHISANSRLVVTIASGSSVFNIVGSSADEFPSIPDVKRVNTFTMQECILRDMIKQTIFSISADASKQAITGERLSVTDSVFSIAASDGFRIAHRYSEMSGTVPNLNVIVPGETLKEIVKLLSGTDGNDASVYFTDKFILFELNACTVVSRIIEAKFIEFGQLLNSPYTTLIKANRAALLSSLERACVIADDTSKKMPVFLEIANDLVVLSANTKKGSSREEISAQVEGSELKIKFNPRFLIDALKAIEDSEIAMQFEGELKPSIIRAIGTGKYKYLVLPLRPEK